MKTIGAIRKACGAAALAAQQTATLPLASPAEGSDLSGTVTLPASLDQPFAAILDDVHHPYTSAYAAPHDRRDGAGRRLSVTAGGGKCRVHARQGYRLTPGPGTKP